MKQVPDKDHNAFITDFMQAKNKKMNRVIFFALVLFISYSCGIQHELKRSYTNQHEATLEESFGTPKTIIENNNEKIYIFEKTEELRSTEINQGKLTLDPMVTPKVTKTERYIFTVREGIIIKTDFEKDYER